MPQDPNFDQSTYDKLFAIVKEAQGDESLSGNAILGSLASVTGQMVGGSALDRDGLGAALRWTGDMVSASAESAFVHWNPDAAAATPMPAESEHFDAPLLNAVYVALAEAQGRGADAGKVLHTLATMIGHMIGPSAGSIKEARQIAEGAAKVLVDSAKGFYRQHQVPSDSVN